MAIVAATAAGAAFTPEQDRVISKVLWRIVPFLLLCYVFAYLDRVNVGVAGLTMNHDLGLSPSQFGWSAGQLRLGADLGRCVSHPWRDPDPRRRDQPATRSAGPRRRARVTANICNGSIP